MLSISSITALLNVMVNSVKDADDQRIGKYRTGAELEMFLGAAGIEFQLGMQSRLPGVRKAIMNARKSPDGQGAIKRLFEQVADSREYPDDPEWHRRTLEYLNHSLRADGLELRRVGQVYRLVSAAPGAAVTEAFDNTLERLDFDSVRADFERALERADDDPEDAITAACSTVESVCKCLLDEMNLQYPSRQDIRGLVTEVAKHLDLSPGRNDLPAEIEQDVRQILGGLASVTGGIGALRTHAGDAHGRGKQAFDVDSSLARLAIHAASTVCLFYIETWNRMKEPMSG